MPTPNVPAVPAGRVRALLVSAVGVVVLAGVALPPALTGVHQARADASTLPAAGRLAAAALVAPAAGQLDLFYPLANGSLYHAHQSGTATWGGGENLGGYIVGGAAATAPSAGSLVVFVRGSNNQLYVDSRGAGAWSGWASLGGGLTAKPAATSSNGRLDVFVRGTTGRLYTRSQSSGSWGPWQDLGGVLAAGTGPAAVALGGGSVAVFVQGTTGALYQNLRSGSGRWSGWLTLGGRVLNDPAAAVPASGQPSVFVRGSTSALYENTRGSTGTWSGWFNLGGATTTGPAAAASAASSRVDVVVMGTDGRLYQRTQTGTWSGWYPITPAILLKPALGGLLTRGVPNGTEAPYLGGFAVVPSWAQLEPAPGRFDFSYIDTRLATARKDGMGVRLRVIAGTQAPDWAKSIGGAPMPAYDHQRNLTTTIGRFWTPAYQAAWQQLQAALAARYDGDPTVRDVNISGTGVTSAEVMLLMATDVVPSTGRTNGSYWLAAGYSEAQRQAALAGDINFMAAVWPHTRLDLCVHAMQLLGPTGAVTSSVPTSMSVFNAARAAHPSVNAFNTGFGMPIVTGSQGSLRSIYDALLAEHAPFDVQTLNVSAGMGDPNVVLPWAASHGMLSLELPGGQDWLGWSGPLLSTTNAQLKANAAALR